MYKVLDISIEVNKNLEPKVLSRSILLCVEEYLDRLTMNEARTTLTEAIKNIYDYAYPNENGKFNIIINYDQQNERLKFKVIDFGIGIPNIQEAIEPHSVQIENETRLTMGFTIMSVMSRDFKVESKSGVTLSFEYDTQLDA